MKEKSFVHLHCHSSQGSLLDGMSKIPDLCKRVAELEMPAIAVTDHGSLAGSLSLIREAKSAGILPIVGMEAYCAPFARQSHQGGGFSGKEHAFHLTLLAQNSEGFRNLIRLSSLAFLEGYYYKPRIDREILERHSAGLICLSGCVSSEFSDHLLHRKRTEAEALAAWYARVFPGRFFIEIQNNGIQIQRDHESLAVDLANRMGLPLVATSDAHYLHRADAPAHDILLCVNTGRTVDDKTRMRFENDQFFVRSPQEMRHAMPDRAEALARTAEIAATVEPYYQSFGIGKRQFPSFAVPATHTADTYLRKLCLDNLDSRYGSPPGPGVVARLDHELGIIASMGFSAYMLIVWDFVRFAREAGIPNSARGSACGSIVAYLLYISHVDPIRYGLLFERFLDPNRFEAPDIDIDICKERRAEVMAYVRTKYGSANVAQICTFGTMAAKAAVKDVGRALNIPLDRVESATKLIPNKPNTKLRPSIEASPELARMGSDPQLGRMLRLALKLEGTVRSVGTHAAGVVIADRPLMDLVPLQRPSKIKEGEDNDTIEGMSLTQWEMDDIEKAGLLKMDFLGLRSLTLLGRATAMVRRSNPDFDPYEIPTDDTATFSLLQRGEALGVFQLDGAGIRNLLVRMKPDRFEDIMAVISLYRPGPIEGGMIDQYIEVKHGKKPAEYIHESMKEILENTYGVLSYQEQVMGILNKLGGIDLTQAYACIKAISKKKLDAVKEFRREFIVGSARNGLESSKADRVFQLIEFFAGYAFNRAHACSYALLGYQTAYIKANYPAEFMAALLSSEMGGSERQKFLVPHISDARRMGLRIFRPDVNSGDVEFQATQSDAITFGLACIKGIGRPTFNAILRARQSSPFASLDDFARRVGPDYIQKSVLETLIHAGVFDRFGRRAQLLSIIPQTIASIRAGHKIPAALQTNFFNQFDGAEPPAPLAITLPDIPEMPEAERLLREKEVLGFYMSGHPLAAHSGPIRNFATHTPDNEIPPGQPVIMGGIVSNFDVKTIKTARGIGKRAKFLLETLDGSIPVMVWPNTLAAWPQIADDWIGFVHGRINTDRDPAELVADSFTPIGRFADLCRAVVVASPAGLGESEASRIARIGRIAVEHPGNLHLFSDTRSPDGGQNVRLGADYRVRYDSDLFRKLRAEFGAGSVLLVGSKGAIPAFP